MSDDESPQVHVIHPPGGNMYAFALGDGGQTIRGDALMAVLGVADAGRFRDAWVEREPGGSLVIAIYTRNGGGNRAAYAEQIKAMRANRFYLRDADDRFDTTYATFRFSVPQPFREHLEQVAVDPIDTDKRWADAIEALGGERPTY